MLRDLMRNNCTAMMPHGITLCSEKIVAVLQQLSCYKESAHVGAYLPIHNEVDVTPLYQSSDKNFYVPVISSQNSMTFYSYTSSSTLIKNRYGILEPDTNLASQIHFDCLDCLIIPLIAFDAKKNRLGHGAGFYDRYLSHYNNTAKKPVTIGVGYDNQKIDCIPTDAWDIPLDIIVSEKAVY